MASDYAPGRTAQQLASDHIAFAISNLRALAEKGGRGAGDRLRATELLLLTAGQHPDQQLSGSKNSLAAAALSGGQGAKLTLVDAEAIKRFHERAGGERGDGR